MNNGAILAIIGGLLILFSGNISIPGFSRSVDSAFRQEIQSSIPFGKGGDATKMANTIRVLANTIAQNPQIESEDKGALLKRALELSFDNDFDFKVQYPETYSRLVTWAKENVDEDISRKDFVLKLRELAEALE